MAALQGIPQELKEAAQIDGANPIRMFFSVTLPLIRNVTFLLMITSVITSLKNFTVIQVLTGGGPGRATTTLVLSIYNSAFKDYKMGYASAISVILLFIVLAVSLLQKAAFRGDQEKRRRGV